MCGLTGGWSPRQFDRLANALPVMTACLAHRGPDGSGQWTDAEVGIALGHRRLAIIGVGPQGHQPMLSASGRYVLVYNGEIYNHLDLRTELDASGRGPAWFGQSDTETLLAGFEAWGVEATLCRAVGMFAFALWDRAERELVLARDRLGEKPLYYGLARETLLFGSELKALRAGPDFDESIDRDALALLLRHGYVPQPRSIYRGTAKLPPGTLLRINQTMLGSGVLPQPAAYWSIDAAHERALKEPFTGSPAEAVDELERLLQQAVGGQMLSEVPLGAFLSGGVDSSAIVALMQSHSMQPVKTFSIGFHEHGFDEAAHARAVAAHLGTHHTELYVTAAEAMAVIPQLPQVYDEPFADSSQIPTFLVSQLARTQVAVSLSGDGGDELFHGYPRYQLLERYWRLLGTLPRPMKRAAAGTIRGVPAHAWDRSFDMLRPLLRRGLAARANGVRMHRLADVITTDEAAQCYRLLMSHWSDAEAIVLGAMPVTTAMTREFDSARGSLRVHAANADLGSYLPDDILAKVDRAAMAVSLETRVPLLDHRIVEFALSLPDGLKRHASQSKWPLRQVLYRHVPARLIERPKMGFGVPMGAWLRGPMREWAEALLDETRLRREGWFEPSAIRRKWTEHLSGQCDWKYPLWNVLMFQAWLDSTRMPVQA